MINVLDYHLATKIVKSDTLSDQFTDAKENPYRMPGTPPGQLDKKQPTLTRQELLPPNMSEVPKVKEQLEPIVDGFLNGLKRVEELRLELKGLKDKFAAIIKPKESEISGLLSKLTEQTQNIGIAIQDCSETETQVIQRYKEFLFAAEESISHNVVQTMDKDAQIALIQGILLEVNKEVAEVVLAKFTQALSKTQVASNTIEKQLRVWKAPNTMLQGQRSEILIAQMDAQSVDLVEDIYHDIIAAVSGLHQCIGILHKGQETLKKDSNIVKMPMRKEVPLAAMRLSNIKLG